MLFRSDSDAIKRAITYQDSSMVEKEEKVYSKKEEEKIKKRLEALGYIE